MASVSKICSTCNLLRHADEFRERKKGTGKYRGNCKHCERELNKSYSPRKRARQNELLKNNSPEHIKRKEYLREWRSRPEVRERHRLNHLENKEKHNELVREHYRNNLPYYRAKLAKRRAAKLKATPSWSDTKRIQHIYWMCDLISMLTGIEHHVDHIHPLQGKDICGLHVPENLQILTKTENLSKGNRWKEVDYR